jgi:hypothetical protein
MNNPLSGNQTNPVVMSEMSQQAAPSTPPLLRAPAVVKPPPKPVPLITVSTPVTATPTTQPVGTPPQEVQARQPSIVHSQKLVTNADETQIAPTEQAIPYSENDLVNQLEDYKNTAREQQRIAGVDLDALRKGLTQYEQSNPGVNLTPFATLSDMWFGGNLAQAAKAVAPESQAEKMKNAQEMRAKIASAQSGLTENELKAMQQALQQYSYGLGRQTKVDVAKIGADARKAGLANQTTRTATAQDRLAAQAGNSIHDDALIKKSEMQRQQIELDKHTLDSAPILTPQIFNEIQIGLANAISGGRSAAVSTQEKTEFISIENQMTQLKQRIKNKPEDIGSPEVKKMLSDTLGRLNQAYQNNAYARAKQKAAGKAKAYAHTPNALDALNEAVESYNPAKRGAAEPSPGPAVDADLSKMTPDELQKYIDTHGGQ